MPVVPKRFAPPPDLVAGFAAIRAELGLASAFPPEVLADAEASAKRGPTTFGHLPGRQTRHLSKSGAIEASVDLRDVEFVTIDPEGSLDLDQAVHLARRGRGYRLRYAIADVAAFVEPGSPVDVEARRRGVTVYLPDARIPLHPPVLSEGAASLLPEVERPALVWTIDLDADATPTATRVERALVRSGRAWSYEEGQAAIDGGNAPDTLSVLAEVGPLRQAREQERGGVSLDLPDQVVVRDEAGGYRLAFRAPLPVEGWNAQISLLTGMEAARMMLDVGVGILRTLPAAEPEAIASVRRRANALGVAWPEGATYGEVISALDARVDREAVLLTQAARLLRGAAYTSFQKGAPPADAVHAAVAAPYAHVTAPLRRLVDRFGNEVVLSACAGTAVPSWVTDALDEVPELMQQARQREGAADRMAIDLMEAAVLSTRIGEPLDGVIVSIARDRAQVQVRDPAVVVSAPAGRRSIGDDVIVEVVAADAVKRTVEASLRAR